MELIKLSQFTKKDRWGHEVELIRGTESVCIRYNGTRVYVFVDQKANEIGVNVFDHAHNKILSFREGTDEEEE